MPLRSFRSAGEGPDSANKINIQSTHTHTHTQAGHLRKGTPRLIHDIVPWNSVGVNRQIRAAVRRQGTGKAEGQRNWRHYRADGLRRWGAYDGGLGRTTAGDAGEMFECQSMLFVDLSFFPHTQSRPPDTRFFEHRSRKSGRRRRLGHDRLRGEARCLGSASVGHRGAGSLRAQTPAESSSCSVGAGRWVKLEGKTDEGEAARRAAQRAAKEGGGRGALRKHGSWSTCIVGNRRRSRQPSPTVLDMQSASSPRVVEDKLSAIRRRLA